MGIKKYNIRSIKAEKRKQKFVERKQKDKGGKMNYKLDRWKDHETGEMTDDIDFFKDNKEVCLELAATVKAIINPLHEVTRALGNTDFLYELSAKYARAGKKTLNNWRV